jgi:hypothetical protein
MPLKEIDPADHREKQGEMSAFSRAPMSQRRKAFPLQIYLMLLEKKEKKLLPISLLAPPVPLIIPRKADINPMLTIKEKDPPMQNPSAFQTPLKCRKKLLLQPIW